MILPGLRDLSDSLARHPSFQAARAKLSKAEPQTVQLSGLTLTARALYLSLLYQFLDRPLIVVVESNPAADALAEPLTAFFELFEIPAHRGAPLVLPAHDVTPYDGLSPHAEICEKRGIGLWRMAENAVPIAIAPLGSALLKTADAPFYRALTWRISPGDEFFVEDLEHGLTSVGYSRHEPVEMVGQYSVRGGIIDVYPPESPYPLRIELFGDQVESIRQFDPDTQKSVRRVDEAVLLPLSDYPTSPELVAEFDADEEEPTGQPAILPPGWEFHPAAAAQRKTGLLDLLPRAVIVWDERSNLKAHYERLTDRIASAAQTARGALDAGAYYQTLEELDQTAQKHSQIFLDQLGMAEGAEYLDIPTQPTPRFQGNIPHCMREVQAQVGAGSRALFTGLTLGDVERLADILTEYGISFQLALKDPTKAITPYLQEKAYVAGPVAGTIVAQAAVRQGTAFPESKVILYGAEDLFGSSDIVARQRKERSAASTFLTDLQDLKPGDLVVHVEHGIGRYQGTQQIAQGGRSEDFMMIEYAEQARLYLPLTRLDLLQKYHGAGGRPPALDRMGGQTWTKTKSRIKAKLVDMADELLKLYAQRKLATGFSFSPDSNWQREFEDAFEYAETNDQLTSIRDIKRDMEAPQTMDRLVCGDVGFGKTEVAMRAAFKALGDGKQVAVLAPTTVLAFQHFETFKQRFAAFPVEIEMLTRFRNAKEQRAIIERLTAGKVDLVIGTHRILSKDVVFSDLGLLIVDEEQRFGVRHKERLKQIRRNVDVITLTATPIPRTLHMSLVGLRDISIIQTPPKDRLAIQTVVAPSSDQLIRTAIQQEVGRGGQVYFIHNRVDSIWAVAGHIQELLRHVRIGVGHGQMPEKELEKVILKFMRYEYDVFVSTTIVENGLDIPLANTILIDRADRYGLAELYQLRGRVGRSTRRAYAYLLVDPDTELSPVARKRLAALKEFSELGSGFKIAALDLELRGAGNLLGAQQHGQIGAVGFEMYCRLLDETVRELSGEKVEPEVRTNLRLQLDVHIPPEYIADETQRLQTYKRLAGVRSEEERSQAAAELEDRYGPLPQAVVNLTEYSLLKTVAEGLRINSVERRVNRLFVHFRDDSKVDAKKLMSFVAKTPGVTFAPNGELQWAIGEARGAPLLAMVKSLFERLAQDGA